MLEPRDDIVMRMNLDLIVSLLRGKTVSYTAVMGKGDQLITVRLVPTFSDGVFLTREELRDMQFAWETNAIGRYIMANQEHD